MSDSGRHTPLEVPTQQGQNGHNSPVGPESKELLQYGGQAVIEGVMMRSPHYFAVACRKPDGSIVVQREEVDKTVLGKISRMKWPKWPFVRGTFALLDAMALGTRALAFASNVQLQAEQDKQDKVTELASSVSAVSAASPKSALEEELTASAASIVNGIPVAAPVTMPRSGRSTTSLSAAPSCSASSSPCCCSNCCPR